MKELKMILQWLESKQWVPQLFQQQTWEAYLHGESGLISVPTGAGKTYAAYLPALMQIALKGEQDRTQILYITPLRALARDLEQALRKPIEDLKLPIRVEARTGDTPASRRKKQLKKPSEILLTTPESLSVLLCDPEAKHRLGSLKAVLVDEWHELLSTKRGVLLELALARLKKRNPQMQIWGMTATIGNREEAAAACVGMDRQAKLISSPLKRKIILKTVLPMTLQQLPWAGQLGLRMVPYVLKELDPSHSCLIFANTRAQAERWYQALVEAKPQWSSWIALHHGSLDPLERESIERGVKEGTIKFVVCTSSLDLGVDFAPVDQVIQLGSPKSIARLIQRAGRASHQPLAPCHLKIVPTHALELVEISAFRQALAENVVEKRSPLTGCYDVLSQHLLTCASGGGFLSTEMLNEVKTTYAYRNLSREEFERCLQFLSEGGHALAAYPEYKKLICEGDRYSIRDKKLILRHKMNIGTIASSPQASVKFVKGQRLGSIDEKFVADLQPGQTFVFAGRILELIQYRDLTAYVRLAHSKTTLATVWQGSRLPYSFLLSQYLRQSIACTGADFPEKPLLEEMRRIQSYLSYVPSQEELLIEIFHSQEGWHLFFYPFEGRNIHEGLASLIAHRLSSRQRGTYTLSVNDYGIEIISHTPFLEETLTSALFHLNEWQEELRQISNIPELAKGYFRDIARIAGLVFQELPGFRKTSRQLQITTRLLYEVFRKYDPNHLLLHQAEQEMLQEKFQIDRMPTLLRRLSTAPIMIRHLKKLSPFALPLYIERVSSRLSTESLTERIERIKASWTPALFA